ncbi:MAG: metallophosphoesterase family protein [Acidobacteria bacterium]|nr:metallophosphoesterase family protein [Acidobacteriota bacterium]
MRYLIFSDIHSNLEAMEVLLRWAKRKKIDKYVVLGDLVGYAASPNQVVDRIRKLRPLEIVRGNHDKVACGIESGEDFNTAALYAANWTQQKLTKANVAFLREMPQGPRRVDDAFLICHGAPYHEDAYLFSEYDATLAFASFKENLCFFGHTHIPRIYFQNPSGDVGFMNLRGDEVRFDFEDGCRYLINPGSLGQPRDRNFKISFAVFDSEKRTLTSYRKPYQFTVTQSKITKAQLPQMLATRLGMGI